MTRFSALIITVALMLTLASASAWQPRDEPPAAAAVGPDDDPVRMLLAELDRLNGENETLRQTLARTRLELTTARQELDEKRQFIADHHQLGQDFQQYQVVKAAAAKAAQASAAETRRQARAMQDAERRARAQEARARRDQQRAENERVSYYRNRGFSPLGLDVYLSSMGYQYHVTDATGSRIDYRGPGRGHVLRLYPGSRIDYSEVTISGSVINASEATRNIGIAVTFFDELGNQVGHETVQVSNARPDVPYPFTSTVAMALDRPFSSSSQYVLYSDPVEAE